MSAYQTTNNVAWSDDYVRFLHALVPAVAASAEFRRIPVSALWQRFDGPVRAFHRRASSRNVLLHSGRSIAVRVLAMTSSDNPPTFTEIQITEEGAGVLASMPSSATAPFVNPPYGPIALGNGESLARFLREASLRGSAAVVLDFAVLRTSFG